MARINVPLTTLAGKKLIVLNNALITVSRDAERLLAILNQITAGGTDTATLETDPEAGMPAGDGAAVYAGVVAINQALAGLAAFSAQIDKG
jgi:hypothetical protein